MLDRISHLLRFKPPHHELQGLLFASGDTVPSAAVGYAPSCIFQHTDGGAGTVLYINEGTYASSSFQAVAALTAAQEALLSATAGVATASKALILDASGHLASGPVILDDMTPGTGISTGTGTICEHSVVKVGGIIKTTILLDVTGLNGCGAAGDVIGVDGAAANCHIGQITAAKNGTVTAGRMTCLETPAGGNVDIDLYGNVTEATLAQDTAISAATGEAILINHGAWAAGVMDELSALPAADGYLYLVTGANTDADFTAGKFLIEMLGV